MDTSQRTAAAVLSVLLVGIFAVYAAAEGLGAPEVPEGAVAVVEDVENGTISTEEFERTLRQVAATQGLTGDALPQEGDPQYDLLVDAALNDLILGRWVRGEAEAREIEVSGREIGNELDAIVSEQFGGERQFRRFLRESGFSMQEARERIELEIMSQRLQQQVIPPDVEIDTDRIRALYEENAEQFTTPERRDVRLILNPDRAKVERAMELLRSDDSPKAWARVAERLSTDEASKDRGGLLEGVTADTPPTPELAGPIFEAPEGELVGPIETDLGFYALQVRSITPRETTSLEDASEGIRAQLLSMEQQQLAASFQEDFGARWRKRTACAEGFEVERCIDVEAPRAACPAEVAADRGCPAVIEAFPVVEPGSVTVGGQATKRPQGPVTGQPQAPAGLPPELLGPGGTTAPPPPGTP